jgi:hypothetical protein
MKKRVPAVATQTNRQTARIKLPKIATTKNNAVAL